MKNKIVLILSILSITMTGCMHSWLDEESYGATVDVFKTEEGSEALVHLLYKKLNVYGGTYSLGIVTENGTDTWLRAAENQSPMIPDYRVDQFDNAVAWLWNHFYKALWNTNLFLESYDEMEYKDPAVKAMRKGEVLTLQAFYLWHVTEQWGDTYLPKSTKEEEGLTATRSSRKEFYDKIISNLTEAIPYLPESSKELGRITKGVAKSFLARMYLYNENWEQAAELSKDVIENYGYSLEPSWNDLWDESKKVNKEFIWTVEFTDDDAFGAGGSWYWRAFAMSKIDRFAGVKAELNYTGYGESGCQFLPTKYYLSLFDKKADLRWAQGHRSVWLYNDTKDDTSLYPLMKELHKDTALYLCPDVLTEEYKASKKNKYALYDLTDLYDENGKPKDRGTFIELTKFEDQTRSNVTSNISSRNYPIIRLGEIYLIAAEANIHLNKPEVALEYVQKLRERATADGFEKQMQLTVSDMNIQFILDERGRELGGEHQRWYDLKRTGMLEQRLKAYNPDASPYFKEYHKVRPIPQIQLDGMPNPETLGQNPGY